MSKPKEIKHVVLMRGALRELITLCQEEVNSVGPNIMGIQGELNQVTCLYCLHLIVQDCLSETFRISRISTAANIQIGTLLRKKRREPKEE